MALPRSVQPLELWGGHECTINRVEDHFFDQSAASGHDLRPDDLDRFASLGIKAIRYPVLWERVSPTRPDLYDWSDSDVRLKRISELGLRPILGLVHHGSGPAYTDLHSESFAFGLAHHARHTAERYPWVKDWTPVNEPLTTARFSSLYGHWYPHKQDEALFWSAVLNQIDAIIMSMAEVRSVTPDSRLVQTEDLGHTYSTRRMAHQADFYNLRRWVTWDLLAGHVTRDHPLWNRIASFGFENRLKHIAYAPCPPDVLGINHYLTSDRFLDQRISRYPPFSIGHNGQERFADIEAVRVVAPARNSIEIAMREAWDRYRAPIALTEIHNGCTREEQMRWTVEAWATASVLQKEGIDVRAVTAWSLVGSFGWNELLKRAGGSYECGVYDIRTVPPRPTAMVGLLKSIAHNGGATHPILANPGWWQRNNRLSYPPAFAPTATSSAFRKPMTGSRPLLITGGTGSLGQAIAQACELRGIDVIVTQREQLNLDEPAEIARLLDATKPWALINTAAWVRVDDAERDPAGCIRINREGSISLGRACLERGIHFTAFSTDLVFNGLYSLGYSEADVTNPLNVYGQSKAEADLTLLSLDGPVLLIRTAAFFSAFDRHNFAMHVIDTLRRNKQFSAADCVVSPTFVPDLVKTVLDFVIDGEIGLWHVVNDGGASWADFGREIARAAKLDSKLIVETKTAEMGWCAVRPAFSQMRTARGQIMPTLNDAIRRFSLDISSGNI